MKIVFLFLLFEKTLDPSKFYKEGKFKEYLGVFYSDAKYAKNPEYIAYTSLVYLELGSVDSSFHYFKQIPLENTNLLTLQGLSYRLGEVLKVIGKYKESAEAFYISYSSGYRGNEALEHLSTIFGIKTEDMVDSLLYGLFTQRKLTLIAPLSGDFSDVGDEFIKGFKMSYRGDFGIIDEEYISEEKTLPLTSLIVGPLKSASVRYLERVYREPIIWFSPISEYLPYGPQFFYSPFKTLKKETEFLIDYIIDSMSIMKIILVRDTSWLDSIYADYARESLARRGKFPKYEIVVSNPFEFDSIANDIDSEKVELALISGLSPNSYFIYSAFRTRFPEKIVAGSSGWLFRLFQVPRYMLNILIASVPVSEDVVFRIAEEADRFSKSFYSLYNYHPSDAGMLGYDLGRLFTEIDDSCLASVLLNMRSSGSYVGATGIFFEFSSGFRIYELKAGSINIRREPYGKEEY
ncbi:MAG: hypothetical protein KA126_06975 [Candidatus Hydrothermae bacterium]|nr:hypothetical protein [Candidatus Hydrothermae bacterium]